MKTPGKFGEDIVLTPEERLIEVERKYSVMIERIQAYDKVLHEFVSLKSVLNTLSESHKDTATQVVQLLSVINELGNSSSKVSQEIKEDLSLLSGKISSFPSSIEEVKKQITSEVSSVRQFANGIDVKHMGSQANFLIPQDLEEMKNSVLNIISNSNNDIDQVIRKLNSLGSIQNNMEEKQNILRESHGNLSLLASDLKKSTDDKFKGSEFMIKSLKDYVESSLDKVKDQVINYMNDTKIEMIGSPTSIESVRKEILNKLNMTALDGSNAFLKSSNNEQQIKILEKKLENLSMLMKKNDLNKMG